MPGLTEIVRPLRPVRLLVAVALLAGGCATRPPASDADAVAEYHANNDPLEPTNRFLYRVNNVLDDNVVKPVAQGYRYVVPAVVRRSISNALSNVSSPVIFANDVLQGHPRYAAETVTRFVVNSTVGVAGFFDVANGLGLPPHQNASFGTTLALWGVGDGPYLFLPLLGPSNIRDTGGLGGDALLDPFVWASFGGVSTLELSRAGVGGVSAREQLLDPVDQVKQNSLDPYATFRSAYRQRRAADIAAARSDGPPLPRPHDIPAQPAPSQPPPQLPP